MTEYTPTSEQRHGSTSTTSQPFPEEETLVTIPYSETEECEPPVPMVPLKSPERISRDSSEEPPPISPPSSSSSIYTKSINPTIVEMSRSVEEHTCRLPSSMLEPMSASIYDAAWEEVFPVEEVMDEVTGLPVYIAPWIIRSESDEDDNRRVAEWTPPSVSPSLKRQAADNRTAKNPPYKWKQNRNVEPLASQPKKKRNFWMSFRRSKKAVTAAVTGSSDGPASPKSNESSPMGPGSSPKPQSPTSNLARKGTVRENYAPSAANAVARPAREPDRTPIHPKPLVVSAAEEVKHTVVSVTEVEVPTPPTTPKNEELNCAACRELGHKITMAIPEGELLNDELRARLCC
ncbi:uncharacterized protein MAM_06277 [Metarhizium album ARSEF 1941]|uniref:Uncharacterized protein n=1 Tax=Metarhizium album (strain ARSEF 1941) TaxID=1081103 RepID=A0A0B2WSI5_METAS|nr:uncharacterized protein MAM_06277 [Metarhizium album ARSEF 1941]KHN95915.1 hypothetical protein MAM_06277 [Metarhizium album ARSEF 1941]